MILNIVRFGGMSKIDDPAVFSFRWDSTVHISAETHRLGDRPRPPPVPLQRDLHICREIDLRIAAPIYGHLQKKNMR